MPLQSNTNDSLVKQWKSEYFIPCSFCIGTRQQDPNYVIVSLESGNDTVSICEVCLKGATNAAAREYRRIAAKHRKPPTGPKDPKRKRNDKSYK